MVVVVVVVFDVRGNMRVCHTCSWVDARCVCEQHCLGCPLTEGAAAVSDPAAGAEAELDAGLAAPVTAGLASGAVGGADGCKSRKAPAEPTTVPTIAATIGKFS